MTVKIEDEGARNVIVSQGYPLWVVYRDDESLSGPYLVVMWSVREDGEHVPTPLNPNNGADDGVPFYGLTQLEAIDAARSGQQIWGQSV